MTGSMGVMSGPSDAKPTIAEYKVAIKALDVAREAAIERLDTAHGTGGIAGGQKSVALLKGALDAFKDIRARLTPIDLAIAEFNIETSGPLTVSLVIPQGISRWDFLVRVSEAIASNGEAPFVAQYLLSKWQADGAFMKPCRESTRIALECFVGDPVGKGFEEQRAFVEERGYSMASIVDVAVGHVGHAMVAGRSMFGGFWNLRCCDGLLQLDGHGRCITNHDIFQSLQVSPAIGSIVRVGRSS